MMLYAMTSYAAKASPGLCDAAIIRASNQTGVPQSVLQAIAITETGRNRNGTTTTWPWTVNMEGRGEWFDTPDAAKDFARHHLNNGARSFDVGCFQINYKWHHQNFRSLDEMFDPNRNAFYAASFLRDLHDELGTWEDAAGAYHSRTPELADLYKARFAQNLSRYAQNHSSSSSRQPRAIEEIGPSNRLSLAVRSNTYPLLIRGGAVTSMGSLVPMIGALGAVPLVARAAPEERS